MVAERQAAAAEVADAVSGRTALIVTDKISGQSVSQCYQFISVLGVRKFIPMSMSTDCLLTSLICQGGVGYEVSFYVEDRAIHVGLDLHGSCNVPTLCSS